MVQCTSAEPGSHKAVAALSPLLLGDKARAPFTLFYSWPSCLHRICFFPSDSRLYPKLLQCVMDNKPHISTCARCWTFPVLAPCPALQLPGVLYGFLQVSVPSVGEKVQTISCLLWQFWQQQLVCIWRN